MIYFLYGSKAILAYDVLLWWHQMQLMHYFFQSASQFPIYPYFSLKRVPFKIMVFSFLSLSFYFILLLTLTLSHFMVRTSPYANHNVIHGYDLIIACNIILSSIINLFLIRKVIIYFLKLIIRAYKLILTRTGKKANLNMYYS